MGSLVKPDSSRHKFSPKISKICAMCGLDFVGVSSNQKTCTPECSRKYNAKKQRYDSKKNQTLKGYQDQKGLNNNVFKKSSEPSRKNWIYSKYRKDYCEVCETKHLDTKLTFVVHHRDGNSTNDVPSNLITLCHSCHKFVHRGKIVLDKV